MIDGRRGVLSGTLRRFPDPPLWLWVAVLAGWLGAGAPALIGHRRDLVRSAALALAVVAAGAATVAAAAFALDGYASPGTWIVGVDGIIFLAVGIGVMRRGPQHLHVAGALWVGLVSVALGLLNGEVFLHPIVLAILPGTVMRVLVVTAIGAGASAAVLGSTRFSEITAAAAPPDSVSS
jgi:hypothetical protein